MTKEQKQQLYLKGKKSPRSYARESVISKAYETSKQRNSTFTGINVMNKQAKSIVDKNTIELMEPIRDFQDQTFVHSIKTRDILKNNRIGQPRSQNPKFVPASKREAKEAISRRIKHINELDHMVEYWTAQNKSRYGKEEVNNQSRNKDEITGQGEVKNYSKMVSDSNFGGGKNFSKLETAS